MSPHSIIPWFSRSQTPCVPLCTRVGPLCVRRHRVPPSVSARSQARMREGLEAAAQGPGRLSVPASIWFVRPGSDGHSHPICFWGQAPSAAPPRPSVTLVEGRGAAGGGDRRPGSPGVGWDELQHPQSRAGNDGVRAQGRRAPPALRGSRAPQQLPTKASSPPAACPCPRLVPMSTANLLPFLWSACWPVCLHAHHQPVPVPATTLSPLMPPLCPCRYHHPVPINATTLSPSPFPSCPHPLLGSTAARTLLHCSRVSCSPHGLGVNPASPLSPRRLR